MGKQNHKHYTIPSLIATVFVFGFFPVIQKLMLRWDSGDDSYCYLIVPLFIYLCWEKQKEFRFDVFSWSLWGLIPVALSVLLMIVGELGSVETLLYTGIWGCIVGVMFVLYGLRLKQLLFPILILAFLVPMPPFINRMLTFNLKLAASTLSVMMMRLSGVTVLQEGNVIDIGVQQLQVVDACSGLRYFVPLILLSLLVGYFFNRRIWQRAVLLLLAPPQSVVVNAIRIFATAMLILGGHPELAEDFFHDFSGWLVFMVAGAILFGIAQLLRLFDRNPEKKSLQTKPVMPEPLPSPAWIPHALTVALCALFIAGGWAVRTIPTSVVVPERNQFTTFPMEIGNWKGDRGSLSQKILDSLWADDYVTATYTHSSPGNSIHLLIPYYEYQGTRHTAHAPQACLLGGGWDLMQTKDIPMAANNGHKAVLRTMLLKKGEHRMLGSYFFFQRGRVIISPWLNKLYLVWDAMTRRRTDGALVRVELLLHPDQSLDEGYRLLNGFIADLWKILPQYVPE